MPAHLPATCRVVARVGDKFGHVRVDRVTYSVPKRLYVYERAGVPKHLRPLVGGDGERGPDRPELGGHPAGGRPPWPPGPMPSRPGDRLGDSCGQSFQLTHVTGWRSVCGKPGSRKE